MNTQLFIVPQLLEGVGPINAATKNMAEQMGTDDPREVFRRINSGEWIVKPKPLFSVIATNPLCALGEKKTSVCFPKRRYAYRDGNLDNWLPANQPDSGPCIISTCAASRTWTFVEAAQAVLGMNTADKVVLGNELIRRGHTITLLQDELMVEKTERGEKTGMCTTDGQGNFAFVETGNENDPVSVAGVGRGGPDWDAYVRSLDDSLRWDAGRRLLVRNLDASKL